MSVARVYVAGPLFTPQDRAVLETIAGALRHLGHEPFLPHKAFPTKPLTDDAQARAAFSFLLEAIESCDALVALCDGLDVDAGTCVEIGYAHALRRPILALRSDTRTGGERAGVNLMAFGAAAHVATLGEWTQEAVAEAVKPFLSTVRVFAGTLVRDAVPKLLESEGQEVRFRTVDEREYPYVLKRKLVEAARELEDGEFGVEQERIADLLELLETLINARKYDRESLKSIKESRWRKRGGYERGVLVATEPQLRSSSSP